MGQIRMIKAITRPMGEKTMTQGLLSEISKAWNQFWGQSPCTHTKISVLNQGSHCPDCGEVVRLEWKQLQCVGCNSKRVLTRSTVQPTPVDQYCRHCGESETTWVTKAQIEAYEILYSVAHKITGPVPMTTAQGTTYAQVDPPASVSDGVIFSSGSKSRPEFFHASPYTWTTESKRPLRALTAR